jgi:hypothetical protein
MSGGKSREVEEFSFTERVWDDNSSPYSAPPTALYPYSGIHTEALIESHGHQYRSLGAVRGDIGGNFMVLKHDYEGSSSGKHLFYEGAFTWRETELFAHRHNFNDSAFPLIVPTPASELLETGSSAIAATLPTSPRVNTAAMAGELISEGFMTFGFLEQLRTRAKVANAAGANYLEAQFGWVPLINDITKLSNVMKNQTRLIQQYVKSSGVRLKRRLDFPSPATSEHEQYTSLPRPIVGITRSPYDGYGTTHLTTTYDRKVWFEGCYTYPVPSLEGVGLEENILRNNELRQYLYGTDITPAVLWQIAPWSWAIDWFSNVGDLTKNFSELADGGLTLEYAYMMETQTKSSTYLQTQKFIEQADPSEWYQTVPLELSGQYVTTSQTFSSTMKQRVAVGPYNLGAAWEGLSPYQASIAGALAFART